MVCWQGAWHGRNLSRFFLQMIGRYFNVKKDILKRAVSGLYHYFYTHCGVYLENTITILSSHLEDSNALNIDQKKAT